MRDFQDAMQREKGRRGNAARVAGWAASVLLSAGLLAGCGTSPPDNISLPTGGSASSPASPSSQTVSAPSAAAATPVQSHDLRTEPVRWEQSKPGCQGKHCPAITLDSLGFPDLPRLTVAIDQMLSSMTGVDENLSGVYGNVPGYAAYFWRTAQDGDHTWLRARLRGVVGNAVSIELDSTQQIAGAAHPIPATHFLLWNRRADKQLRLDDVLVEGRHAQYLAALRTAYGLWLKANPGYQRDPAGYAKLWPFLESDNVALTGQGLVVKYDAYTIAPYSYGQPEIVLPWATARTFVRPEFLPD
ncbi:MAG TPA: RsiV family protein [Bordetella sp.]